MNQPIATPPAARPLDMANKPRRGARIIIRSAGMAGAAYAAHEANGAIWQFATVVDYRAGMIVLTGRVADEYFYPIDGSLWWAPRAALDSATAPQHLYGADDAEPVREATAEEISTSNDAAQKDGGAGIFIGDDGRRYYTT